MVTVESILNKLGIESVNPGACYGADGWITPKEGKRLVSVNPATGEELATVIQADEESYDIVVAKAAEAFKTWRMTPAPRRGQLVRDLGIALRELKEPLGELVTLEMGKIRQEGLGEVQEMIDICDFAVGLSRQLYGKSMHSERPLHRMYEHWHPLGIVGVISAFNFPVAVWSWNAAIASVCGDPVIWKPSSSTPLTAIAVQRICNQVMADYGLDGLFGVVIGPGRTVGERLISDQRIPLISFTGSTAMGRRVNEVVAKRLGNTILELGGNNAIIVSENADLDMVIPAIVFGAVGTAGQRCTSTRRIIAHSSIVDTLTDRIVHAYKQVRIGNPIDENTLMGPLVNRTAVDTMMKALETVQTHGGTIVTGGKELPEHGENFVEPAVVRMSKQTDIVRDETFAPILYILAYDTIDEAVEIHNDVPQGLSSAIFTTNLLEAEQFLSHGGSDCGIANVNIGTSGAEIGGAFGGEKDTGGGREAGSDAWQAYMRRQTSTTNWSKELPLAQGIKFELS